MALDTFYTSATYNSFSDLETMNTVMTNLSVLYNALFWIELDDQVKEALIKASTRQMNTKDWRGEQNALIVVKSMKFPRSGLDNIEDDEIPEELLLRMGCWIIHNASANGNGSGNISAGMVKSKSVGDVSLTYETNADILRVTGADSDGNPCGGYASDLILEETIGGIGGVGLKRKL